MTEQDSTSRPLRRSPNNAGKPNLIFAVGGLLIVGGIIYWGFLQEEPYPADSQPAAVIVEAPEDTVEPAAASIVPATDEPATLVEPIIEENPAETEILEAPAPEPTMSLADANALLPEVVATLGTGTLGEAFTQQPNGVERGIAIVDNLRQGEVPYKLLPVGRPSKGFPFSDDGLAVTLDPSGFERYNGLANAVNRIDTQAAIGLYQQFKAPIGEAWNMLGYSDISFEQALIQALEVMMTAPDTAADARLIKREANWLYEDPELESLPALQKQLMRMGNANAEKIKDKARELRSALLDSAD